MKSVLHEIQIRKEELEKAVLVGVHIRAKGALSPTISLAELKKLATTASYETAATITQSLVTIEPKTFLGRGKVDELQKLARFHSADTIIFDEALIISDASNLACLS